jgi:DNA-binding response OmpR family regulator
MGDSDVEGCDEREPLPPGGQPLCNGHARSVLVVEDESFTREFISTSLRRAGYRVTAVEDGANALRIVRDVPLDLAVLDVGLPDMSGWQLCEQVRSTIDLPILFLTARRSETDIVRGLRVGADDYLVKPFAPAVLAARVEAILRRVGPRAEAEPVRLPGLTIDIGRGTVLRDEVPVALTASELRILATLAREQGGVVDARQLALEAQGYDLSKVEASRLIKVHVSNLRQKLEPDPRTPRYILTVRGIGYRLNMNRG